MQTLLRVHHSHTDLGYTDAQARVAAWQVAYIRQALAAVAAAGSASRRATSTSAS